MINTVADLPEDVKQYELVMTDKNRIIINGSQKKNLLQANVQFVELKDGTVINKAHIVGIYFEARSTKDAFNQLSDDRKKELMQSDHIIEINKTFI